jgi:hypothetical protein
LRNDNTQRLVEPVESDDQEIREYIEAINQTYENNNIEYTDLRTRLIDELNDQSTPVTPERIAEITNAINSLSQTQVEIISEMVKRLNQKREDNIRNKF